MTTFTTEDRLKAQTDDDDYYGIPFAGWVKINYNEDTIRMLREQLHIVQAECQRLRKILMEHGLND